LRTRNFCRVCIVVAASGGATVPFLPGRTDVKIMFLSVVALSIGALAHLVYRTRRPETLHVGIGSALGWYIPTLSVAASIAYFGPYSPAPILFVLAIYVIGMGSSLRLAMAVYLTAAISQGVLGSLAIVGVADPGFITAEDLELYVRVLAQVLVQLVYLASFVISRASRRSSLTALGELETAIRAVAQREALLAEAREELQRALGSGRGRFTDQTIGHYQLGNLLGRGGMGEVYEAVDTRNGGVVAVKLLAHASLGNPEHVERFFREIRAASAIDSPNIVRVLEIGEQPLPHLVMERLVGEDLASILRRERILPPSRLIELVHQLAFGLTAARAAGVVHRDLKPQNVFDARGTWKILDFGIARFTDAGDTLTAGQVVGTPAYMAPEQARGEVVDHRADLYSLAAITYRALTGQAAFSGVELADVVYRVVHTSPRRPSSLVSVHDDVDLVLAIAMAKQPSDRFASAAQFAVAFESALDGRLPDATRHAGLELAVNGAWQGRATTHPLGLQRATTSRLR